MNTNTNNMNANNDATAPAQDIRRRLQSMIYTKDWTGITNIIQEQQQQQQHGQLQLQHTADNSTNVTTSTTSSTPNGTLLKEVVNILASNKKLPYILLQEKAE